MAVASENALCSHCLLPTDGTATRRMVHGESHHFCCYGCCLAFQVRHGIGEESEATWLLIRIGVGGFFAMNVMLLSLLLYSGTFEVADQEVQPWIHLLLWLLATPVLVVLGGPFIYDAWLHGRRGRLTSSTLIALGTSAAYGYSVVSLLRGDDQLYFDTATMLLLLFTVGRYLEAVGRARAVRSLAPLLEAEGQWATVLEGGRELRRRAREIAAGTLVRVRPGERVAVDGLVRQGEAHVDEAVITGESRYLDKAPGARVVAGSIVLDGPLLVRADTAGTDTRWARVCRLVRAALAQRSPMHRLADRAASMLVPFVLVLAAATVLFWSDALPLEQALLIGLAVLVVACPCGLGLAAPMADSLGIGRLARHGCLVRGGAVVEALSRVRVVAFDKTGTLTQGRPRLAALETDDVDPSEALALAAGLELQSEHSLARGVIDAAQARGLRPQAAQAVTVVPGRGLRGTVAGREVAAGSARWMAEFGWPVPADLAARAGQLDGAGHSLVHLAWGGRVRAVLAFDDTVRADARDVIDELRRARLSVVLLTGDRPAVAERVAAELGIGQWHAELAPEAKLAALEDLRRNRGPVAMVGDGVNDGPVLAAADVGLAVGSATDLARETADLVLPAEGLHILPWILVVARAVRRTMLASLLWVLAYNAAALSLAALGLLQPVLAAALMAGSSLFVVLNSLRLERLAYPAPVGAPELRAAQPKMSSVKARYQTSA